MIICFAFNFIAVNSYASPQMNYPKVQIIAHCEDTVDMDEQDGLTPEIEEMLMNNSKQLCFDRTDALIKIIKKYLRKHSVPVVDQNGDMVIEVEIKKTYQFKTIDPVGIEKVALKGLLFQKDLFTVEFDQSDQKSKKSIEQIAKILADKIIKRIHVDEN